MSNHEYGFPEPQVTVEWVAKCETDCIPHPTATLTAPRRRENGDFYLIDIPACMICLSPIPEGEFKERTTQ